MLRFLAGAAILFLSLAIEFIFAFAGWHFELALAVLIAFSFVFDFWELLVFDLLAVFLLNWQPGPSIALIAFAIIPLATYASHRIIHSEAWIGNLTSIFIGFLVFYIAAAPSLFFHTIFGFLLDVAVGLVAGEMVLFGLA